MKKNVFIKSFLTTVAIFLIYSFLKSLFISLNVNLLDFDINIRSFNLKNYISHLFYIIIVYTLNGVFLFFCILTFLFFLYRTKKEIRNDYILILYLIIFFSLTVVFNTNFTYNLNDFLNSVISLVIAIILHVRINKIQ